MTINVRDGAATPKLANALVLIVNEFVSNSVKHAFGSAPGAIAIAIDAQGDRWAITCQDDGRATPQDAGRAAAGSGLGTRVIQSLAASLGTAPRWHADGAGMALRLGSTDA